jgi:hypothetical protein
MNCAVHPDREASGYCRNCGKAMCGECSHKVRDVLYCEDCLARQVGLPPVAAAVANAEGVPSGATATPVTADRAVAKHGDGIRDILILILVIFPFYMSIDAMRSAKAKITGEPLSDPFENWSSQRPLGPIILIAVGALFLLNNFNVFEFLHLRQIFVPLLLIGIGFIMLRNRVGGKN